MTCAAVAEVVSDLHCVLFVLIDATVCDELRCVAGDGLAAVAASGVMCDAMAVRVSCRQLALDRNQLSGSIPSTLGSLTALQ